MMDAGVFKILDWLAPKGIGVLDNICQPLSEIFVVTDTTDPSTIHEAKKVRFFIDNLITENLINTPDRPDDILGERHPSGGYRWLDFPIGAWITLNGFNLLREEKLRREGKDLQSSIIKTNQSVEETNKATKKLNDEVLPRNFKDQNKHEKRTLALGIISAVFIGITVWKELTDKTSERLKELQKTMQENKVQIDKLDISLQNVVDAIRQRPDSIRVKILKK